MLKGVNIILKMYGILCKMYVSSPMIFYIYFVANGSDILKLCICHFEEETKRPLETSKVLSFVYYRMTTLYDLLFPQFLSNQFETLHRCYRHIKNALHMLEKELYMTKLPPFKL